MTIRWLPLVLLGLGSGCGSVKVVDTVDDDFDFLPWSVPHGTLHGDYVAGAHVSFHILGQHESVQGYSLSGDPRVFQLTGVHQVTSDDTEIDATLLEPGDVTLLVQNEDGNPVQVQPIHVALPDRVDFLPSGPLFAHEPEVGTEVAPQLLAGGTATFMARYFENGSPLYGSGGLSVTPKSTTPNEGVSAIVEQTFFSEVRDWVQVTTGTAALPSQLTLTLANTNVLDVPVTLVEDSAITNVTLFAEPEAHAYNDESLVLLAQSTSADGESVWGVDYTFTVDGVEMANMVPSGEGSPFNSEPSTFPVDMYVYSYDKADPVNVEAAHGAMSDGVLIHSSGGVVTSSNFIGCSTLPGGPGSGSPFVVLMLVLVALWRRESQKSAAR